MQTIIVALGAVLCFGFGVFLMRKGVRMFRRGAKILGSFVFITSLQFLIYPILMIASILP